MTRRLAPYLFPLLLLGCRPATLAPVPTEPPAVNLPASVQQLTPDQAATAIQNTPDLVVIDLREDWEVKTHGIISGSVHIDYLNDALFASSIAKLNIAKPYLLYCAIGGRSKLAATAMSAKGFNRLSILAGGLDAWRHAGKPLVK